MKRYLIFAGQDYYASGGWRDFKKDFDTLEEIDKYIESDLTKETTTDLVELRLGNGKSEEIRDGVKRKYKWNTFDWLDIVDTQIGKVIKSHDGLGFIDNKPKIELNDIVKKARANDNEKT